MASLETRLQESLVEAVVLGLTNDGQEAWLPSQAANIRNEPLLRVSFEDISNMPRSLSMHLEHNLVSRKMIRMRRHLSCSFIPISPPHQMMWCVGYDEQDSSDMKGGG
ncbi:hypothetical protein [Oryza sativa Japonica Group]|uniref:Uncharacterized protein n=1 Tax=Oryza sativa subsp. japonica TaxID=39947 RepID=Q5QN15_ORYSJ|nr:hypothetical protein [Oryza sativa Japonica Group]